MGWLPIVIGCTASFLHFRAGSTVWLIGSIVATLLALWSWGVMHNYAAQAAKLRSNYSKQFSDFTEAEVDTVPNWAAFINMIAAVACILLLIATVF